MKPLFICYCLLLLTACSNGKGGGAIYQTRFNFSQVERYSTYERNSDFSETQNISDTTRNGIEMAIERSMDKQGFLYSEVNQADVIVSYHILGRKPQDYARYNKAVLYCEYCLRASNWQNNKKSWRLTPGNLILDLVDPKTNRSVWRSVYPLNITIKDNSQAVNEKIQLAVKTMLSLYPEMPLSNASSSR